MGDHNTKGAAAGLFDIRVPTNNVQYEKINQCYD